METEQVLLINCPFRTKPRPSREDRPSRESGNPHTMRWILICLFLTICHYTYGKSHDYKPADLKEVAYYPAEDFLSSFFLSPFLLSNEDTEPRVTLADEDFHRFLKFKTKTVTGYTVEYSTAHPYSPGDNIKASGLLLIPSSSKPLPLLVYHRPTLLNKRAAPSRIPRTMAEIDPVYNTLAVSMVMLALQGYIVLAPDYTGYGSSDDIRHPYLHKKSVTQTSLDMFFSTTKTLKEKDALLNGDVHVMGYSQGAHGAMSFAQGFQENNQSEFIMRSISAGGGPYDISETVRQLLSQDSINRVTTLLFLQAYTHIYDWDLSTIVRESSFREVIESAFEYEDIREPAEQIPGKINKLFKPQLVEDIQAKRDSSKEKVFEENSVYRWVPDASVFLFHTRYDTIVPYSNMEIAYEAFSRDKSTSVTRKNCSLERFYNFLSASKMFNHDGDIDNRKLSHGNCYFIFVLEASDYIDSL